MKNTETMNTKDNEQTEDFRVKIVAKALSKSQTIEYLSEKYKINPITILLWKQELRDKLNNSNESSLFPNSSLFDSEQVISQLI